ncbi:MAG: adenylyl-sulfate kinase [Candidatus Kerfeldbacteria bacterium]
MKQKATNITWHEGDVTKEDREKLLGQKGVVIWFTGLSGSGKSTLAVEVEKKLFTQGRACYRLDGDNVRHGINKDLGFSDEDRTENIRRIGEVAKLFADAGIIVMTSFISPFRADRDIVRALLPEGEFIEAYVQCSLEECERRDPKGLYKKARAGEIPDFTGIDSAYEEPMDPEIVVATDKMGIEEATDFLLKELGRLGVLNGEVQQ